MNDSDRQIPDRAALKPMLPEQRDETVDFNQVSQQSYITIPQAISTHDPAPVISHSQGEDPRTVITHLPPQMETEIHVPFVQASPTFDPIPDPATYAPVLPMVETGPPPPAPAAKIQQIIEQNIEPKPVIEPPTPMPDPVTTSDLPHPEEILVEEGGANTEANQTELPNPALPPPAGVQMLQNLFMGVPAWLLWVMGGIAVVMLLKGKSRG